MRYCPHFTNGNVKGFHRFVALESGKIKHLRALTILHSFRKSQSSSTDMLFISVHPTTKYLPGKGQEPRHHAALHPISMGFSVLQARCHAGLGQVPPAHQGPLDQQPCPPRHHLLPPKNHHPQTWGGHAPSLVQVAPKVAK